MLKMEIRDYQGHIIDTNDKEYMTLITTQDELLYIELQLRLKNATLCKNKCFSISELSFMNSPLEYKKYVHAHLFTILTHLLVQLGHESYHHYFCYSYYELLSHILDDPIYVNSLKNMCQYFKNSTELNEYIIYLIHCLLMYY